MADIKVSEMPQATDMNPEDLIMLIQGGGNKKANMQLLQESVNKYSTDEQIIGTWIDGKPLYRKVIEGTLSAPDISGGTWFRVVANVHKLINVYGFVDDRPYNYYSITRNNYIVTSLDFAVAGNTIMYRNLGLAENSAFNIVLEYTKVGV